MKRLLIGDYREDLLSTLDLVLKHWGFRVVASSCPEHIRDFLHKTSPDLLIMGSRILTGKNSPLTEAIAHKVVSEACPLIVMSEEGLPDTLEVPHEILEVPIDVFALFALLQRHIEKQPRKNLRLSVKLPGMFSTEDTCSLTEVLSLSPQGMFIKTGARLEEDDRIRVAFPLMGMMKELELDGRVLYFIEPGPENNYLQGVGVEFTTLSVEDGLALRRFIECCFLGELSASQRGVDGLAKDQIRTISPEITLKLAQSSPPLTICD